MYIYIYIYTYIFILDRVGKKWEERGATNLCFVVELNINYKVINFDGEISDGKEVAKN
jgi:N-acetylneuraminic acid mutarotase